MCVKTLLKCHKMPNFAPSFINKSLTLMKKIYNFALASVLAFTMGSAAAQSMYVKVQSEPEDWTGAYLIVYEADDDNNVANVFNGALKAKELDSKANFFTATNAPKEINGESVRVIEDSEEIYNALFYITRSEDKSAYYIKSSSGYYIGYDNAEKGEPNLEYSDETPMANTIAMEEGKTSVNIIGSVGNYQLRFNADEGKERFRYHELGKKKSIKLYQKVDETIDGINDVKDASAAKQVFNLQGQPTDGLQKGLNVVDGKLILK